MKQDQAFQFVKRIKELGLQMPELQLSKIGSLNIAATFDKMPETIMANNASTGMDFDLDLAVTKSMVEFFERKSFQFGVQNSDPNCTTWLHSDGVAAFPTYYPNAAEKAKNNAFNEAVERFVWANWWDNPHIGHKVSLLENTSFWKDLKLQVTLEKLTDIVPIQSLLVIEPKIATDNKAIILFAQIRGHGFISGGAAGSSANMSEIFIRGFAELVRHGLAIKRFLDTKKTPATFYEQRLLYFGLGDGNKLVQERLSIQSDEFLQLPELKIDSQIQDKNTNNLIVTHRCLFENQPPFVDGTLERLCL